MYQKKLYARIALSFSSCKFSEDVPCSQSAGAKMGDDMNGTVTSANACFENYSPTLFFLSFLSSSSGTLVHTTREVHNRFLSDESKVPKIETSMSHQSSEIWLAWLNTVMVVPDGLQKLFYQLIVQVAYSTACDKRVLADILILVAIRLHWSKNALCRVAGKNKTKNKNKKRTCKQETKVVKMLYYKILNPVFRQGLRLFDRAYRSVENNGLIYSTLFTVWKTRRYRMRKVEERTPSVAGHGPFF